MGNRYKYRALTVVFHYCDTVGVGVGFTLWLFLTVVFQYCDKVDVNTTGEKVS